MIHMEEVQWGLYLVLSYLVGGVMTGYLVAKVLKGVDLRTEGSRNIGARNAGRVLGPAGFVLTLVGDLVKGGAVVWAAVELGYPPVIQLLGFLAVIIGHLYPVFLKFHGGKGVASFIGALLVFNWLSAVLVGAAFLLFYSIRRSLTVAGLFSFVLAPFFYWLTEKQWLETLLLIPISLIVVYVQKEDIKERIMLRE
ncbi:glycerol-3-phosphate acyltransferase [Fictibacillus nanhaiensis]|uniref:glycerol-3-phosphate acyltransferase n=1 Tax=Fictibacillus nanhaiensis TaxID=742169 RepID=UPI001C96DE82|nr:glycerol-3-phosphate acyltransferase [Fictibacillus nanhaiensis]MBY6037535.1 glycerol-3-phosphate acyltransferase [Fictibacillus nanhaiensis]